MVISTGTTLPTCAWAAAGWLRWHLPACSLDSSLALAALQLLHLVERKLHRGLAAEDRHQHLDLLLARHDRRDQPGPAEGQGAGVDLRPRDPGGASRPAWSRGSWRLPSRRAASA